MAERKRDTCFTSLHKGVSKNRVFKLANVDFRDDIIFRSLECLLVIIELYCWIYVCGCTTRITSKSALFEGGGLLCGKCLIEHYITCIC